MAEDRKMNEFQVSNNVEYVYGETSDGSQVKILKSNLVNKKGFFMKVNQEIDLGFNVSGLLCINAASITGTPAVVMAIMNSIYFSEISNLSNVFVFGREEPGKVCIYKTEDVGNIKAKNLTGTESNLHISIL